MTNTKQPLSVESFKRQAGEVPTNRPPVQICLSGRSISMLPTSQKGMLKFVEVIDTVVNHCSDTNAFHSPFIMSMHPITPT